MTSAESTEKVVKRAKGAAWFLPATVVVLAVVLAFVGLRGEETRHQVSPCVINVNSAKCQNYRHRQARSGSNRVACIDFHRATGRTGRRCESASEGGGSQQTSSPPSQQPTPPSGGDQGTDQPPSNGGSQGGSGGHTTPTPGSPPPAEPPAVLDLVKPLTDQLGVDCHVEVGALGVQVTVCD